MATRSADMSPGVREAFRLCEQMAREHYENFPVASRLLPADRRMYVAAVYAFARTADDFADEGERSSAERLRLLDEYEHRLREAYAGRPEGFVFVAIAETASRTGIPLELLASLLTAFRMDVTRNRYQTYAELLGYCEHSANPVGRLVLHLFEEAHPAQEECSDKICTALQLANFWQDLSRDLARGRLYVPLEDLERFGYTEADLAARRSDDRFTRLMRFQVERTRALFHQGEGLLRSVGGRLRFEVSLTYRGGLGILRKIERSGYDVLNHRPTLSIWDKIAILAGAGLQTRP